MKKTIRKLTCSLLAAVSVFGCAATMSACETNYPKVEMVLEFNGVSYTLDYKLYREIAPATVQHFLWLADNGYYDDGLCVHDYDSTGARMYTGSYTTDTDSSAATLVYKKYFDEIKGYSNFSEFPQAVWFDSDKALPTYTLKGEFEDNDFGVESGFLQETYGSLTMYYEHINKDEEADQTVYFANGADTGISDRKYQYNHTTSAFFISMTTNPKTNNNYCTFATLEEDSEEVLEDLQEAIENYISANYESEEEFTQEVTVDLFEDDEQIDSKNTAEYDVPLQAIVIKKVTVKKY